ncbi:hypothetical protein HZC31_07810 [Candidatus Woesearchaeota archaeon]|nr:hypothetical protein [Candidatus Woesearchaeota archaeon]
MTEEGLSALLAFHANEDLMSGYSSLLSRRGYTTIDCVDTAAGLMERHATRPGGYDLYAMDVNLGNPNGFDFTAARYIYELISPVVESGLVKFYPASGSFDIVEAAQRQELPAVTKAKLGEIITAIPLVSK